MISYKIEKINVKNFRNLDSEVLSFSEGINFIYGQNGQGKTNILEAIYYIINRKSFRKNISFPQILSINCEQPEILFSTVFRNNKNERISYSGKINNDLADYYLNGSKTKKKIPSKVCLINPFDAFQFFHTPQYRRSLFDQFISEMCDEYKKAISKYNQFLKMRNQLLKLKPENFKSQIQAIDKEWVKLMTFLLNKREEFLREIGPATEEIFKNIFSEEHSIKYELQSKIQGMDEHQIALFLLDRWEKDLVIGVTSYGIHKDDYTLQFNQMNGLEFCSLGQQKTSYLSLLFAYIHLFGYKYRTYPIVLIDDVSGELDEHRWSQLIEYLKTSPFQVVMTSANEKLRQKLEKIKKANHIYVANGSFTTKECDQDDAGQSLSLSI